ncbi:hypothetical protein KP79_PYT01031 [Mizuhopecten yessoensis]|uniref:K Homology domain-containing protein n=1 Tax=Mizuhopecten yessoensis TaxID=6573 RepID=A0A210QLM5_MIZYE|nr:hypothetical protein KP79_PYT01031 [Mizuhopecten yessoensis]
MAAFMRACLCRCIISRPQVTNLSVSRHVKCIESVFLQRILSRPCSYITNYGDDAEQVYRTKVAAHEDSELQKRVAGVFIGKGGSNIKKLNLECKIDVIDGDIWVSGRDAEGVQKTVERVTTEVQRIKDSILLIQEKVSTHENDDTHLKICKQIIGKQGGNIKKILSELGQDVEVQVRKNKLNNHILVSGTDVEMVDRVVEKVQQEVQRIKNEVVLPFSEKVMINEDKEMLSRICGMLIGKGGEKIERFKSETELDFELLCPSKDEEADFLLVSGTDAEVVKEAAGKVQQEVKRIKDFLNRNV